MTDPKLTRLNAIEGWVDEADHAIQMAKFHLLEAYKEHRAEHPDPPIQ